MTEAVSTIQISEYPGERIDRGSIGNAVLQVQHRLNEVGCGPVVEDGTFGSATRNAIKLFQARFSDLDGLPLKIDGVVGPITWAALFGADSASGQSDAPTPLITRALDFAITQIGVIEDPRGSNGGPEVEMYLKSVGLDSGHPWCAAFVYWCFERASQALHRTNPLVRTAGVYSHWQRAKQLGIRCISASDARIHIGLVGPGLIFCIGTGGGHGHTGLVERVAAGKLTTIEGNTDDSGNREGIGVFRKTGRKLSDINLGFIDYSAM